MFAKLENANESKISGPINEPPLPRRKKCPELAYRTHEFIGRDDDNAKHNTMVSSARLSRARVS